MSTHVVVGAGPVGRAVVASLAARGVEPVVVTRSGAAVRGAMSRQADVRDPRVLSGAAVVFQCAQPPYHRWPEEFPALQAAVVDGAARAGAVLVAAENLYGYGPVSEPITEDLPLAATTRKGSVRTRMWQELASAHQRGRLRVVAGRASDFFGPGVEDSAAGGRLVRALAKGRPAAVLGDPDRRHTYTYVPDFGEALVRLSETPATWGRAWHVPNPPTVTTRAFADTVAAQVGRTARLRPLAPWQLRLLGLAVPALRESVEMLHQFDRDWVVDHAAYAAVLGDHATPLAEAIGRTLQAVRSAGPLRNRAIVAGGGVV